MRCPVCDDIKMREVEKDGVLIDVCPECKGVWLDRGELDKLMSGVREMRTLLEDDYKERKRHSYDDYDKKHKYEDKYVYDHYKKKKKKTALDIFSDLFE